jgi:uncharacterized FlaG/YvyC family protein
MTMFQNAAPPPNSMNQNMKTEELITEWRYRYDEMLGMMGVTAKDKPTDEQDRIAKEEADAVMERLKSDE